MESIPGIRLSLGQMLWALNQGQPADKLLRNEVRYLRQLGIPHSQQVVGKGRGNRIFYNFEDLIEVGAALNAVRRGMKTQEAARVLIRDRKVFRKLYRQAWLEQPETVLSVEEVKSRGRISTMLSNEKFLRLHDRYSSKSGEYEIIGPGGADSFGMSETFPDKEKRVLVPLTKLVIALVVWARKAPEVRPGRPS